MDSLDSIINEEIDNFNKEINSSDLLLNKIHNHLKDVSMLKNNLELVSDYINRKQYLPAYKTMLSTLESLLTINNSILQSIEKSQSS